MDHHPELLDLVTEADPHRARQLRIRLQGWLREVGVAAAVIEDFILAVYEALAYVVGHAYPLDHPHPVMRLQARVDHDELGITVTDHGRWRMPPPKPGYRGRGLAVMRALATTCTCTAALRARRCTCAPVSHGHGSTESTSQHYQQ
jgi:serine/threonine-protein kinase RsbW